MSKEHKKHADIQKPSGGKIHRNEIAFIGAPCGIIQDLCQKIAANLSDCKIGFIDADHSASETSTAFNTHYVDKISYHNLSFHSEDVTYDFRHFMESNLLTLVNGNHFKAAKQVVFIHDKKKESLQRKLDRLTDVQLFILDEGQDDIYDFLKEYNESFNQLPKIKISDLSAISETIDKQVKEALPIVNGLVLAGGQSTRMGKDKGILNYHGKPQRQHTAEMLDQICANTYLSLQKNDESSEFPIIEDSFLDLGPYGGILSALRHNPNAAWLTVATDIPLLTLDSLKKLIEQREPNKMATCFHNPETQFPEPLITLWEPQAYPRLLYFLSLGYSCPRKVLINSDVKEIALDNSEILFNANTPEEMKEAMTKIND